MLGLKGGGHNALEKPWTNLRQLSGLFSATGRSSHAGAAY